MRFTCRDVRANLSDVLDGEVSGPYATYVRVHSRLCVPCRAVRRSYERTRSLLHALRDEPVPDDDTSE